MPVSATWSEVDFSGALPPAVNSILAALNGALSTIATFLNAVVAVFNVLKNLITSATDFLEAVLSALRTDIEALIESLEEAGVRLLVYFPRSVQNAVTPRQWVAKVARSMTDAGDPNRPDFTANVDHAGCLVMLTGTNWSELLSGAKTVVESLGKPFKYRDNIVGLKPKVDAWATNTEYADGDLVVSDDLYWRCIQDHKSSTADRPTAAADIRDESVLDPLSDLVGLRITLYWEQVPAALVFPPFEIDPEELVDDYGAAATAWNRTVQYTTGALVRHNFMTWRAQQDNIASEPQSGSADWLLFRTARGGGQAPDWAAPVILADIFPFFGSLVRVMKKALGLLVFGLGLSDLIDQYVAFMEAKLATVQALVDEIQEVIDTFAALTALPNMHVLFYEGDGSTPDVQAALVSAPLPDGIVEQGELLMAGGLALHVGGTPGAEIAQTVGLLKAVFGVAA